MILIDLPPELLDQILQHLDKRDLKNLRQTCKSLIVATSWLFGSFTVYPHLHSFERLVNVGSAKHVAECVRHLWYNTAYRGLPKIPSRILLRGAKNASEAEKKSLVKYLQTLYQNTLMGGNTSDELTQMEFFRRALPNLTNLQSLHVVEFPLLEKRGGAYTPPGMRSVRLPEFYEKSLPPYLQWSKPASNRLMDDVVNDPEPRQSHALSLIAGANQAQKLQELSIGGLQWDDFLSQPDLFKRPVIFQSVLNRLKRLSLKAMAAQAHIWDADVMMNLQDMLKLCANLENLVLWFRHSHEMNIGGQPIYDYGADQHCESIFQLDFIEDDFEANLPVSIDARLCWSPRLHSLEVEGLVCTLKELKAVFRHHTATLRSVRLSGLLLLPANTKGSQKLEGPRECLVKMFKWLQKHLELDNFDVYGPMSNGGRQNWRFRRTEAPSCLYQKIISFVKTPTSSTAICPLEYLAIPDGQFDLGSSRYTMQVPDVLREARFKGDESLVTDYSDFDEVPSDDDDDSDDDDSADLSEFSSGSRTTHDDSSDSEWESASSSNVGEDESMPELESQP